MNVTEGEVHIAQVEHRGGEITESQWSRRPLRNDVPSETQRMLGRRKSTGEDWSGE